MRQFFRRLGNPLDWRPVDKAVLCTLAIALMLLSWELWRQFMLASPWLAYINAEVLHAYAGTFQYMILASLLLSGLGLRLRRQAAAQRWFPPLAVQFYALSLCYFGYLIGSLSIATGLVMAGAPLVGFILFSRRVIYPAMLTGISTIIVLSYAAAVGLLPYAPLFPADILHDATAGRVWLFSMLYFSIPQLLMIVLLGDLVMMRWRQRERQIRSLSQTDALTGVHNRRRITELLEHELVQSRRSSSPLAVVMVDLDFFKHINDRWGHQTGDRALRAAAATLQQGLRASDALGRYGGEEFMLLLTHTDSAGAQVLAERCRLLLEQLQLAAPDGQPLAITASFGVFANDRNPALDADDLMRLADDALYRAKAQGRNRVVVWQAGAG